MTDGDSELESQNQQTRSDQLPPSPYTSSLLPGSLLEESPPLIKQVSHQDSPTPGTPCGHYCTLSPDNSLEVSLRAMSAEESEEVKILGQHLLATIVWPVRTPKDNASFVKEFAEHIKNKFNELSPNKYSRELQEFADLRNIALSNLSESSFRDDNSLKALKTYFCQLSAILARFNDCNATFSWKDSFGRGSQEGGLEYEMNNIMYNIAAIHNELGSKVSNASNTRGACLHFSNALWWITDLRDNRTGLKPKEMGHDLLTFFHHMLQAHAQECILLHSIRAGMKVENVAKIAAQVANDYDIATKLSITPLYTDPLRDIISGTWTFQIWKATVDFKHKYFSAITQLLMGLANKDDHAKEIGVRIARLKFASQFLEQGKKLIPDTLDATTTKSAFAALENLITRKLEKAIRYNDNVYHSSIPSRETLPQPEAKLLVSPIAFSPSDIPEFRDLFSGLVTIEAVQVSSIYSQKKDDLSRDINSQVIEQDEQLAQMMSTLNIDKRSLKAPQLETPDELIEICAELSMNPNVVDDVVAKLGKIDHMSDEIQKMFEGISEMLRRSPNRQLQDELNHHKQTHENALRTTQSLHKQLNQELQQKVKLMATTSNPMELLPKKESSTMSGDEETIKRLEKLLDKIDEMKQQRASLLNQLKQSLNDDDIIKHVVVASSEQELKNVFDKEIQKHNKYLEPLQANLRMQNEILDMLERANAQYGQVKLNYRAQRSAYTERVDLLKKFYTQFKVTSEGVEHGLKYHRQMLDVVRKFHAKVRASNDFHDLLN